MASSVGTVIGKIGFGILIDMYGRKRVTLSIFDPDEQIYGRELIVMIIATLNMTLGTTGKSVNVIGLTIFWRIILGIGIGGDYPNSSVLVSEFGTVRWRGAMIAGVFAFQGLGAFSAGLVSLLCTIGFHRSLNSTNCDEICRLSLDKSWRIIYGMGLLPALIALYFRLTIPETIRYTLDISRSESDAVRDVVGFVDGGRVDEIPRFPNIAHLIPGGFHPPPKASLHDFKRYFGRWKNSKILIGTAGSWFLIDIAFVRHLSS
jgi:MFS transporter, PHS family, inorganic phosphate transporter